jgi:hypothetical protein
MTSPFGNAGLCFQPEHEAAKNLSPVPRLSLVPYPDTHLRTVGQPVTTFDSACAIWPKECCRCFTKQRRVAV